MQAPEVVTHLSEPAPVRFGLSLIQGGLAELTPVAETVDPEEQAGQNLAYLQRQGVKFSISHDGSSVRVDLDRRQEALTCALLYGFEITGLEHFPDHSIDVDRPDPDDAIYRFLDAKKRNIKEGFKLDDGTLALVYDRPGNSVYIEQVNDSGDNPLEGKAKRLLKTALSSFDIEAGTAEMGQLLAWKQATGLDAQGIRMLGKSDVLQ